MTKKGIKTMYKDPVSDRINAAQKAVREALDQKLSMEIIQERMAVVKTLMNATYDYHKVSPTE